MSNLSTKVLPVAAGFPPPRGAVENAAGGGALRGGPRRTSAGPGPSEQAEQNSVVFCEGHDSAVH